MHYSFGFLCSTLLYSYALWKLNTTFLCSFPLLKTIIPSVCQRYQILNDLLINSMHFGVGKSYQNTKEVINMMNMHLGHDGLMGRGLSALQSDIWNPVSGS